MVQQNITPDLRLCKLPYRTLKELASILDIPGPRDWKALGAELEIYTRGQIAAFEHQALRPGGSAAFSLLQDLCQQLKTVEELITYLKAIGNQEALLVIKPHEPVAITRHPLSDTVREHQEFVLKCEATGFPLPRYEWLKNGTLIPDAKTHTLRFNKISITDNGEYMCKVTNPMGSVYSYFARIQVAPSNVYIGHDGITASEDIVREIPLSSIANAEETVPMLPGQHFVLNCDTGGSQYFQWQKNGYPMPGQCQPKLIFQSFSGNDEGRYSCKVTNQNGLVTTTNVIHLQKIQDMINPPINVATNSKGGGIREPLPTTVNGFATGKLALVIANQNYLNPRDPNENLVHPQNDATLLESSLEKIGFKVIRLYDLTKREIETAIEGFCRILKCAKDLYSLFYFCGHGFEEAGKTFLMPIDADPQWTTDSAISAESILSKIQQCKTTKLDVLLLDVCRVRLGDSTVQSSSYVPPFMSGAQCVFGYATCPQSKAFEKKSDNNGIYMKHLAAHLKENISVEDVLHKVGAAVRKETESHHLTNCMSPSYKTTTTEKFSLTDPIVPGNFENDPTQEWFNIHRLPSHKSIEFDDDIIIDIKFSSISSNVCCVSIHVASFGLSHWCDANIIELSDDFQVPYDSMNREQPLSSEFLSKCVSFNNQDSTERSSEIEKLTQVSALQKLMGPFAMTIQVQYHTGDRENIKTLASKHIFGNDEFGIAQFFNPL